MQEHRVLLPELALIAATRGMIGFGAGLLVASRLRSQRRKHVGLALLLTGLVSTIPLAVRVFRRRPERRDHERPMQRPVGPIDRYDVVARMAD